MGRYVSSGDAVYTAYRRTLGQCPDHADRGPQVGKTILKADDYAVTCNKDRVTFVRRSDGKNVLEIPCQGTELTARQEDSRTSSEGKDGIRVLVSLIIQGSNILHTFD